MYFDRYNYKGYDIKIYFENGIYSYEIEKGKKKPSQFPESMEICEIMAEEEIDSYIK